MVDLTSSNHQRQRSKIKDDIGLDDDDEEIYAYSDSLATGKKPKLAKKEAKPVSLTEEDEDSAIAQYSMSLAGEQKAANKSKETDSDEISSSHLAEHLLSNKGDDLDDDDQGNKTAGLSQEEKNKIAYWSQQDPDKDKKEKMAKDKKLKEQHEKEMSDHFNSLTQAEQQKLKHQALQQAQKQLNQAGAPGGKPDEGLMELDEEAPETEDWDSVEQYTHFMQKVQQKGEEIKTKVVEAPPVPKKSKEQILKEQKEKALNDDVESVTKLYEQENKKEQKLYSEISKQHVTELDQTEVYLDHADDPEPEVDEPKKQETEAQAQKPEPPAEPVVQQPESEKPSFFEQIWEKAHPEEVQKAKMAKQQQEMAEKAKKLEEEAKKLKQKSLEIKNSTSTNSTTHAKKEKHEKKEALVQIKQKEPSIDELMAEGKSLGEIQTIIQEQKPYYKQQKVMEAKMKEEEEQREFEEMTKDALRDPMQELIDQYADMADKKDQNGTQNATAQKAAANTTEPSKKLDKKEIEPKEDPGPLVPKPGNELENKDQANQKKTPPVSKPLLKDKEINKKPPAEP